MAGDLWLHWTDPHQLLFRGIVPFLSMDEQRLRWARKLRLWTAACCQRLAPLLSQSVLDEAERLLAALADGALTDDQFLARLGPFRERASVLVEGRGAGPAQFEYEALSTLFAALDPDPVDAAELGALGTSRVRALARLGTTDDTSDGVEEGIVGEDGPVAALLREVAGNPFRPVAFAPDWRTSNVTFIARNAYDTRDFSALPILADALQDAGCNSDDLLNHLRDPKATHVRGCWALDLVLGKS